MHVERSEAGEDNKLRTVPGELASSRTQLDSLWKDVAAKKHSCNVHKKVNGKTGDMKRVSTRSPNHAAMWNGETCLALMISDVAVLLVPASQLGFTFIGHVIWIPFHHIQARILSYSTYA